MAVSHNPLDPSGRPPCNPLRVVGCDVGKDSVVVFDSATSRVQTVANAPKALKSALRKLKPAGDALIVCEATGGYEAALLTAAADTGWPAHRADPRKASAFIRSLRSQGKTDAIDARGLARYGLERGSQLVRWQPPSAVQQQLAGLVRGLDVMVQACADFKRRLKAPGSTAARGAFEAIVTAMTVQIAKTEAEIKALINQDQRLAKTVDVICAISGCGFKTAITLAALMPELGQIDRRKAAALAGLAPHPKQSGRTDAYRSVKGGRPRVKSIMHMAALSARRFNPDLKPFYDRLCAKGKKPIAANIATARKLITIINAKIRDAIFQIEKQLC